MLHKRRRAVPSCTDGWSELGGVPTSIHRFQNPEPRSNERSGLYLLLLKFGQKSTLSLYQPLSHRARFRDITLP